MLQKVTLVIKNNYLLIAFILLGAISLITERQKSSAPAAGPLKLAEEPKSVDTFIPRGFVLVPLEIANAESLTSLVGDVGGVVDLYLATNANQKGGLKVGTKMKILRAPLNPQQYAVLVREHESSRLLSYAGPFIAVVQNPDEKGAQINASGPSRLHIDYQN